MTSKKKRLGVLGAVLAVGLFATACGGDDETSTTTGGSETTGAAVEGAEITIALGSEPTSLDPMLVDDGGERAINDNIYETLLARTADGTLEPGLASAMPVQIDDTTWEFTLREGVTFHDGTPFNADAVVASVERIVGLVAAGGTDNDGFFGVLTGATKVDDLTVRITTDGPDGVLPSRMYWLKIVAPSAKDVADLSDAPNGTGPYKFVSRETGVSIVLESNDAYWGGAPSVSKVTYEFVAEGGTRLAGLKSGKYDLITNLPPQDVEQAPAHVAIQGQEHPVLILDADEGITADVNVRKALNLAVDKQAIADKVYGGFAVIDEGQLLSPSIVGYNENVKAYGYDPEEAKRLIEEAGLAGQTITLVGESSGRWLNDKELLEAVAGYWTEAGLVVDLQTPEFGAYLDVLFDRENRADAIFVSSSNDILDPSRQLATYYAAGGIGSSNSNEELAALVDAGRAETDAAAREATYEQAVQMAYDEAYFVWLVSNQDIYGMSERLQWTPRVDSKLLVKEMSVKA